MMENSFFQLTMDILISRREIVERMERILKKIVLYIGGLLHMC